MNGEEIKKINYDFKVLSAIGILMVVCGHVGNQILNLGGGVELLFLSYAVICVYLGVFF